jgi:O-antigen/teichoic acid export membrane protein
MQGLYAGGRAWIDLLGQVALLGFPQALIHALSNGSLTVPRAARINCLFIAGLFLLAAACTWAGIIETFVAAGVLAAAIHLLFRPLVLAARPSVVFNLVSISPSVCLVLGVAFINLSGSPSVNLLIAGSFACGAALTVATVGAGLSLDSSTSSSGPQVWQLLKYGLWYSVVPVVLQTTITGTYQILRSSPNGAVLVGLFSLPVSLTVSGSLPINMVAPLLFKRWAADFAARRCTANFRRIAGYAAALSLAATPVLFCGSLVGITRVFGPGFAQAISPCLVLSCSTYAFLMARLLGAALLAFGLPEVYAVSTIARAATIFLLLWSGWHRSLVGCALSWVAGDVVTLFLSATGIARATGISMSQVLGLPSAGKKKLSPLRSPAASG